MFVVHLWNLRNFARETFLLFLENGNKNRELHIAKVAQPNWEENIWLFSLPKIFRYTELKSFLFFDKNGFNTLRIYWLFFHLVRGLFSKQKWSAWKMYKRNDFQTVYFYFQKKKNVDGWFILLQSKKKSFNCLIIIIIGQHWIFFCGATGSGWEFWNTYFFWFLIPKSCHFFFVIFCY